MIEFLRGQSNKREEEKNASQKEQLVETLGFYSG